MMQSLLSADESRAFQSFLSAIDGSTEESISATEWALYDAAIPALTNGGSLLMEEDSNPEKREALAKATKDLMSLEPESRWDEDMSAVGSHSSVELIYNLSGYILRQYDQQQDQQILAHQQQVLQRQRQQQQQHHQNSLSSSSRETFPFLRTKRQASQPPQYPTRSPLQVSVSPVNGTSENSSPSTLYPLHQQNALPPQVHIPDQPQQKDATQGFLSASRSKRNSASRATPVTSSTRHALQPSQPSTNGSVNVVNGTAKRNGSLPYNATISAGQKQALLSPSQKKANHIQSEQKRRANIRKGYEALCEKVPALRDAIREEEEVERSTNGKPNGSQRKKGRGKKNAREGDDKDGRAGPRSENVVLAKTIDYIQQLIEDRASLLARLNRARTLLPPGHPAQRPLTADPPWEREWKGGVGRLIDEDPDGSECDDDGEDDE